MRGQRVCPVPQPEILPKKQRFLPAIISSMSRDIQLLGCLPFSTDMDVLGCGARLGPAGACG